MFDCEGCEFGWCGRANGFGGPEAPADRRADAPDGEGGGRTTPEPSFRRVVLGFVLERGEELVFSTGLPFSLPSSGICTFKTGRLPPSEALFVRDGG